MITFGLTGGIACGKSTVNKMFTELGIPLVDADLVSRQVVEPGKEGLYTIAQEFGAHYLNADGSLNRTKLGSLVFSDPDALKRLDKIMLPLIFEESERQIEALHKTHPIVGYDSALIIEMGLADGFRPLVVVYCPSDMQVERIIKRNGLTREEAELRIAAQIPASKKRGYADFPIDTFRSKEETLERVKHIVNSLKTWEGLPLE